MPPQTIRETSVAAEVLGRYDRLLTGMILKVKTHHEADLKAWYAANPTPELQLKNQAAMPALTSTATFRSLPGRLYNGMIHGLEPYDLRGIIWYQADGNMFFRRDTGSCFKP